MEVKKDEDWMQKKWRPAMGWMYMGICTLDMAVFPVLWAVLQMFQNVTITQWQPLTLQGAGLFHIAMGAVLGIAGAGAAAAGLAQCCCCLHQRTAPRAQQPACHPSPWDYTLPITLEICIAGVQLANCRHFLQL